MNVFTYGQDFHKHPREVFFKKAVLKIFAIFTRKHLCWSLQACNFIEKRHQHRCFTVSIAKFLRTSILKNICQRLFLEFAHRFQRHNRKVGPETRDFSWDSRPEIRGPSREWDPEFETRDPVGGTQDPRPGTQLIGGIWDLKPGTLKVGSKTADPGHLFYMGRKTRDQGHWKRDLGHLW